MPPAVSTAIATLEDRHTTIGRGIELTEAGELFVAEARAVLARIEAAELVLSELAGLKRGTLMLQASQTVSSYWLPRHLVAFAVLTLASKFAWRRPKAGLRSEQGVTVVRGALFRPVYRRLPVSPARVPPPLIACVSPAALWCLGCDIARTPHVIKGECTRDSACARLSSTAASSCGINRRHCDMQQQIAQPCTSLVAFVGRESFNPFGQRGVMLDD